MAFTINETAFKLDDVLMAKMLPTMVTVDGTTIEVEEWLRRWTEFLCWKRCSGIPCEVYIPPGWISEARAKLKEDLNKQLRAMEQIPEEMLPRTVARLDELEKNLKANLDQLKKHRAALDKG